MIKAGIVIVLIGVVLTIFTAFTFFTGENIVDIASLQIIADKPHHLYWSPLVGIAIMGLGGVILLMAPKK